MKEGCPNKIVSCVNFGAPPRPRNTAAPITLICCSSSFCCNSGIRIWTLISWCRSFTWWPLWEAFHGRGGACLIPEQCTRIRTRRKIPNYYVVTSSAMSTQGRSEARAYYPTPGRTDRQTDRYSFIGIGVGTLTRLLGLIARGRNHLTTRVLSHCNCSGGQGTSMAVCFPDCSLISSPLLAFPRLSCCTPYLANTMHTKWLAHSNPFASKSIRQKEPLAPHTSTACLFSHHRKTGIRGTHIMNRIDCQKFHAVSHHIPLNTRITMRVLPFETYHLPWWSSHERHVSNPIVGTSDSMAIQVLNKNRTLSA